MNKTKISKLGKIKNFIILNMNLQQMLKINRDFKNYLIIQKKIVEQMV